MRMDYREFNVMLFFFFKTPQTTRKRDLSALRKSPKSPKTVFIIRNSQKVKLSVYLFVIDTSVPTGFLKAVLALHQHYVLFYVQNGELWIA